MANLMCNIPDDLQRLLATSANNDSLQMEDLVIAALKAYLRPETSTQAQERLQTAAQSMSVEALVEMAGKKLTIADWISAFNSKVVVPLENLKIAAQDEREIERIMQAFANLDDAMKGGIEAYLEMHKKQTDAERGRGVPISIKLSTLVPPDDYAMMEKMARARNDARYLAYGRRSFAATTPAVLLKECLGDIPQMALKVILAQAQITTRRGVSRLRQSDLIVRPLQLLPAAQEPDGEEAAISPT